jgi:hypothetical protein
MDPRQRRLAIVVLLVVLIVAACGSDTTSTPTGAIVSAGPTVSPAPPSFADLTETAGPTPESTPAQTQPVPTPTPTSRPASSWTKPRQVGTLANCSSVTAGIDVASRYHVAAECAGSIHYYMSGDTRSWKATVFAHPANRQDLAPQIAFRGDVVYVGYSRIAPDVGCSGTRGVDVGVYFRSRSRPDGPWSDPVQIGSSKDSLQSFRVDGDTIHATVYNAETGRSYYETLTGATFHRYRIVSAGSMRIGSDGRARMAYLGTAGLRYAVFTGAGFSTSRIGGSIAGDSIDSYPVLALDAGNKAHVVWTRREGAACGVGPGVGTYYATNASGKWKVRRITRDVGDASLQVDQATGRVHVLVGGETGLLYLTRSSDGRWARTKVASTKGAPSPALRLDPATGTLLAVYVAPSHEWGPGRIYALTKP